MTRTVATMRQDQHSARGIAPSLLIAVSVIGLSLPSAVLALSSGFDARPAAAPAGELEGAFTPSAVDPRLARQIAVSSLPKGQVFRFTPAGIATRAERAVTVAVRVDARAVPQLVVRGDRPLLPLAAAPLSPTIAPVRIAPTAFNLGVSRGFQGFAPATTLPTEIRRIEMPDLSAFKPSAGQAGAPARFAPRIALDEREKTGRAPRTLESNGEQTVDLGGSYRVSGNLNVTAGVRYSQDRDRLAPLLENRQQDSQAVYVGTQFRF